jgi:hypothetical protein
MGFADGSGVLVHPEALDAEAGVFHAAALALESGGRRVRPALVSAAAALHGWRTGPALDDCAAAWARCLAGLGAELDGHAGDLRATASNYREVDAGVTRSMSAGLRCR